MTAPVQLRFRRSGGLFSGNQLELELDESSLSPEEASALGRAGDLRRFTTLPSRGAGADLYEYELEVGRGDDVVRLSFDQLRLPPDLASLVELLERRAMRERAR